jgi:hypothetical protein
MGLLRIPLLRDPSLISNPAALEEAWRSYMGVRMRATGNAIPRTKRTHGRTQQTITGHRFDAILRTLATIRGAVRDAACDSLEMLRTASDDGIWAESTTQFPLGYCTSAVMVRKVACLPACSKPS